MERRRLLAVAGLACAAACAGLWRPDTTPAPLAAVPRAPAPPPRSAPIPPAAPVPSLAPVDVTDELPRAPDTEEADRRYAEALGQRLVVCPESDLARQGFFETPPTGSAGGRLWFGTDRPRGVRIVRGPSPTGPPLAVLRWWTEPDGAIRCVEEPPAPAIARVRVTDPAGAPIAGALVHVGTMLIGSATTDPDGGAEVTVHNGEPARIEVRVPGAEPVVRWVGPEGATIAVDPSVGWSAEDEIAAIDERVALGALERVEALRALLADPTLPPAVAEVLRARERSETSQLEVHLDARFEADGTPKRGRGAP